ncbi:Kae1-associated serine/threonine protein kinase [archaeon]|jgi:Kae1-associated kinase Bud32|nr:Kae1-associated serine/threonine protein kinase [archaeon]
MKLISQGAEAKIFHIRDKIVKDRIPKGYRHPQLDNQIRRRRTKSEAKLISKALALNINVPKILADPGSSRMIHMQFIEGDRLSETLNSYPEKKQFKVMQQLGEQTALLHKNNIIHGDLTTSNTILSKDKLYIIDFGLGFISTKIEDKAVDLHLIKQALEAKHFQNHEALFKNFLKTYKDKTVIERLTIVEKRGRYKH